MVRPSAETGWVPDACTLPTVERPVRVAAFEALLSTCVVDVERPTAVRLRLNLTPTPDVAARVAELAAREAECCAFFTFGLTIGPEQLILDVDVPTAQVAVLDALARGAKPADGGR